MTDTDRPSVDALIERIRSHVARHGATRTAQVLSVSTRTLTRWLSGERLPRPTHVDALTSALTADAPALDVDAHTFALVLRTATARQLADELVRRTHM